jgi:hypothetical protein
MREKNVDVHKENDRKDRASRVEDDRQDREI